MRYFVMRLSAHPAWASVLVDAYFETVVIIGTKPVVFLDRSVIFDIRSALLGFCFWSFSGDVKNVC
jgi:hypothetical protein